MWGTCWRYDHHQGGGGWDRIRWEVDDDGHYSLSLQYTIHHINILLVSESYDEVGGRYPSILRLGRSYKETIHHINIQLLSDSYVGGSGCNIIEKCLLWRETC